MGSLRYRAIRGAFDVLSLPGIAGAIRALSSSRGVILTLHRVVAATPAAFAPNAILQVTPDFLDAILTRLRGLGIDLVTLDEAIARLSVPSRGRPFATFTFDDGYRDNRDLALPIMQRHDAPFTTYIPPALVDRTGEIWWQAIEDIIAARDEIAFPQDGTERRLPAASTAEKNAAFDALYWHMRRIPEPDRVALMHLLADRYGYDLAAQCAALIMDWDELTAFAADPLCTIGAHTVHHYELAKLPADEARDEIARSVDILAERLGTRPRHLSYPLGGPLSAGDREFAIARDLGLASAVTTRPGGLYANSPLHALPRISLNGLFQAPRYADVFATGAIFTALGRIAG